METNKQRVGTSFATVRRLEGGQQPDFLRSYFNVLALDSGDTSRDPWDVAALIFIVKSEVLRFTSSDTPIVFQNAAVKHLAEYWNRST